MKTDLLWRNFLKYGDSRSFSVLYDTHVDKLYSYGLHLGYREETCKDAIQDVFYKLYTSRENLGHVDNLGAYLFRSIKNRLIDLVRKKKNTKSIELYEDTFTVNVTILDDIIDAENTFLLKNKVEELLNSLTAQQREAVYLRYMHEMDYNEIGELLNINSDSARKLMFRAMRKLREQTINHGSKAQILAILSLISGI